MLRSFLTVTLFVNLIVGQHYTTTTPIGDVVGDEATTPSPYLNDCQEYTTGGCPEDQNDEGFLAFLTRQSPSDCYENCLADYGPVCNSVVFHPNDQNNNGGLGNCTLWKQTVGEYHGKCTLSSGGYYFGLGPDCLDNLDSVQSCEVNSIK